MFDEEEQELQHNPDDDSYGTLRTSDIDDATATTPRHSKKSRKRTRSQDSAASITLDSTHMSQQ